MAPSQLPVELPDRGGFSTPPPQSSFRELDDAFLQNQTRIWLGEVLNMRFDKNMNISDLLADGQILFGVYKVFRTMLLGEKHSSHQKFLQREFVSSSEITEIFPYAKVEWFLDVCRSLGISDIDLFTTSYVVDKRNTRKVCMCLRSLAKKARSKNLNVPDFDSVTHIKKSPVTMSTDMVGNRRRNLERSSKSPTPVSSDIRKGSRRSQQEESVGFHADSSAYKSDDDEDDCGSESVVGNFQGGCTVSSGDSISPRTPDPSMIQDCSFVNCESEQLNIDGPTRDKNANTKCMSVADSVTSPSRNLGSGVGDNFQLIHDQSNHDHENNLPNHSPILLDWQTLDVESADNSVVKSDGCRHIQLADGENAELPQASSVEGMAEPDQSVHNLSNELEVVSANDIKAIEESVRSPLPVVVDMDNFAISSPSHKSGKDLYIAVGSAEAMQNCRDIPCIEDMKVMSNLSNHRCEKSEFVSNGGLENCGEANSKCHVGTIDLPCIEDANKDENEDLKDENKKIVQQYKPPRKMLKLIAGGTGTVAAMGVLLFWLQLRKKGTENAIAPKFSLPNPTRVAATEKHSSGEKRERAAANKLYPASKLKFGS